MLHHTKGLTLFGLLGCRFDAVAVLLNAFHQVESLTELPTTPLLPSHGHDRISMVRPMNSSSDY